ncbi:3-hydroxyacyl-CoA dehydrogenase NAD-binding domain-containing protein, partial [Acinetobacter baumannii]
AISSIAVVGVGAMGRGIAQVAAQGGLEVLLYDAQPGAAAKGRDLLAAQFAALVAKSRLTAADAAAAVARLRPVTALAELA